MHDEKWKTLFTEHPLLAGLSGETRDIAYRTMPHASFMEVLIANGRNSLADWANAQLQDFPPAVPFSLAMAAERYEADKTLGNDVVLLETYKASSGLSDTLGALAGNISARIIIRNKAEAVAQGAMDRFNSTITLNDTSVHMEELLATIVAETEYTLGALHE